MAETRYNYEITSYLESQLTNEIRAANPPLPGFLGVGSYATGVQCIFSDELSVFDKSRLDAIVAAHVPALPRRMRTIYAIRTELNALTSAKKTAIWNNLSSGNPPLWSQDAGPNAAAIAAIEWCATVPAGVSVAEKTEARIRLTAMYVQDNPRYLVNPAFDPTINVPGDEAYTPS